jgi:hypothetical protein
LATTASALTARRRPIGDQPARPARSICAPMLPKKNGVKKAATGATSPSSASRSLDSPTTIPARKAPMIAARPMAAASAARPSMTIIPGRNGVSAKRGAVRSERRRRRMPVPPTRTIPMNATARTRRNETRPAETSPAATPTATARMSMARTSSMIAAPRMTRPDVDRSAPSAPSAFEVIPTEVAVTAAPRKTLAARSNPSTTPRP